jgi:hypothetical protein
MIAQFDQSDHPVLPKAGATDSEMCLTAAKFSFGFTPSERQAGEAEEPFSRNSWNRRLVPRAENGDFNTNSFSSSFFKKQNSFHHSFNYFCHYFNYFLSLSLSETPLSSSTAFFCIYNRQYILDHKCMALLIAFVCYLPTHVCLIKRYQVFEHYIRTKFATPMICKKPICMGFAHFQFSD